ncbi:MAG: hypothetical protein ACC628_17530 [Pirellulaceae bacterium]
MSDDIANFLRRAAQRRSPLPPDIEILDAEIVDAEILEEEDVSGADVSRQVFQHLDTSSFAEHASHLGENVDQSDDRMESHLHQVFEHKLGRLGAQTSAAAESVLDDDGAQAEKKKAPTSASTVADMLRDPRNLRNAMVIREILTRPEHLW